MKKLELDNKQLRQGDVLLVAVDYVPEGTAEDNDGRAVLAHGEVTGHAHAIYDRSAVVKVTAKKERHLSLVKTELLKHEEHTQALLDKPNYRVLIQTQWTDDNEPIVVRD
jgi:hypothetical protein